MSPTYGYVSKLFLNKLFLYSNTKEINKRKKKKTRVLSKILRFFFCQVRIQTIQKRTKKYLDKIVIISPLSKQIVNRNIGRAFKTFLLAKEVIGQYNIWIKKVFTISLSKNVFLYFFHLFHLKSYFQHTNALSYL